MELVLNKEKSPFQKMEKGATECCAPKRALSRRDKIVSILCGSCAYSIENECCLDTYIQSQQGLCLNYMGKKDAFPSCFHLKKSTTQSQKSHYYTWYHELIGYVGILIQPQGQLRFCCEDMEKGLGVPLMDLVNGYGDFIGALRLRVFDDQSIEGSRSCSFVDLGGLERLLALEPTQSGPTRSLIYTLCHQMEKQVLPALLEDCSYTIPSVLTE